MGWTSTAATAGAVSQSKWCWPECCLCVCVRQMRRPVAHKTDERCIIYTIYMRSEPIVAAGSIEPQEAAIEQFAHIKHRAMEHFDFALVCAHA